VFYILRFGLSDQQSGDQADVDHTTANRWRRGASEVPFAVMELLRLRRGQLAKVVGVRGLPGGRGSLGSAGCPLARRHCGP